MSRRHTDRQRSDRRAGYASTGIPTESWADAAPAYGCLALLGIPVALVTVACVVAGVIALPVRALVWLSVIGCALAVPVAFPVRLGRAGRSQDRPHR